MASPQPTLTEQEVRAALVGRQPTSRLPVVFLSIEGRMYKRESDGLFYLLDNGARDEPA